MQTPERGNPSGEAGASGIFARRGLPKNDTEVAQYLQRRLSGFCLAVDVVLQDWPFLMDVVFRTSQGFPVSGDDRTRLHILHLRFFNAGEVLNGD